MYYNTDEDEVVSIIKDTGLYINGILAIKPGTKYGSSLNFKSSTVRYIKLNDNEISKPFTLESDKFFYGIFKGSSACVGTRIRTY